jgi:hypothetical protein
MIVSAVKPVEQHSFWHSDLQSLAPLINGPLFVTPERPIRIPTTNTMIAARRFPKIELVIGGYPYVWLAVRGYLAENKFPA